MRTKYKEELRTECLICKDNQYRLYLASHIFHKHHLTANKYKEMFGLPHNINLISDRVRDLKSKRFGEHRQKYLDNLKVGVNFRFKKGNNRYTNKEYFSRFERENLHKRLTEKDYSGVCLVCKGKFKQLQSHLFNKHRLLDVSKWLVK